MPELLEVRDLKIQARKDDGSTVPIVKGVSFDVKAGEVVALIGESGSGKTTISMSAMGYTRPGLLMTKEVLWHNVETTSMEAAIAIENRNQTIAAARPEVQEHMAAYAARAAGRR